MTHRLRAWLALVLIGAAALVATPAAADPRRASGPSSVFPQPRDPWRSWGVHTELPRHLPPPRQHHHGHHYDHRYGAPAVWVPGQWVWDGYYSQWVWSPGYWRR